MTKTFLSKQFSSKKVSEPSLDLSVLPDFLSISFGQSGKSDQSEKSVSKLSIRLSRMPLYLLRIIAISDFSFIPPIFCLSTVIRKIVTI